MKKPEHGGDVWRYGKAYEILDFSSNGNPLGPPVLLKDALKEALERDIYCFYPDPTYLELKQAISKYLSVAEDKIGVFNGAIEALYLLFRVLNGKKVLLTPPSFTEFWYVANMENLPIEEVPLIEDHDCFKLNEQRLLEHLGGKDLIAILCNPNNPTGTLIRKNLIEEAVGMIRDGFLVVDESFMEFSHENHSSINLIEDHPNLIIVKSLTKIFSASGLRLGVVIASSDIVHKFEALSPTWRVNSLTAFAFSKLLRKTDAVREYLMNSRRFIDLERRRMIKKLRKIGLRPYNSSVNFILVNLCERANSRELKEVLVRQYNMLIRDASTFKGLSENYIRIGLKRPEQNDMLIKALNEVLNPC
ncbi:hypothetical protein DRN86_04140 [Candidatus Geothermarchaeota archaeon]|nr:MAG: hypothetical protein DRN86_04140 [Candidatus Geothermarchaeota archaeon]